MPESFAPSIRQANSAFLVIDVQNDFVSGSMALPGAETIIEPINAVAGVAAHVIVVTDWHPAGHVSFASAHGVPPLAFVDVAYGTQQVWPDHCVQGSDGAEFHEGLHTEPAQMVIRKGFRSEIDSYSAFFENDKTTHTGLEGYLRGREVSRVTLAGLATDYCVAWSAIDAVRLGFETRVKLSACRAIDLDGSLERALAEMQAAGVTLY